MTDQPTQPAKVIDVQMAQAFIIVREDNQIEVIALNPSQDDIIKLTKHWHKQMLEGSEA